MKGIIHINDEKKPDFIKNKEYCLDKIAMFLDQYKQLLAFQLEDICFKDESIYWNWFLKKGNIDFYEKNADKLSKNIDYSINKFIDLLSEDLFFSLEEYTSKLHNEKDKVKSVLSRH